MRTPSTDIFGPVKENNDENIEDEEQEEQEEDEEVEEEQEEEEPEEEEIAAPKRKKKRTTTMNQIHGTRYVKKSGKISKQPTWEKSNSSWIGENPNTMQKMPLSMPYYL